MWIMTNDTGWNICIQVARKPTQCQVFPVCFAKKKVLEDVPWSSCGNSKQQQRLPAKVKLRKLCTRVESHLLWCRGKSSFWSYDQQQLDCITPYTVSLPAWLPQIPESWWSPMAALRRMDPDTLIQGSNQDQNLAWIAPLESNCLR